jgi:translocation and assembly module TamB
MVARRAPARRRERSAPVRQGHAAARRFRARRAPVRSAGRGDHVRRRTAQITGSAADPEIALSSDPALPEDEILPELLFGRSSRELSGFEAAQMAASLASLAGQSAFDIAGAARSAVNLDRLEFREDESGGFLVSGGKYLTRDVFLEVSRGSLGETSTSVEWQVRPRLYVISSFLDNGDQKLAVRWKHDY